MLYNLFCDRCKVQKEKLELHLKSVSHNESAVNLENDSVREFLDNYCGKVVVDNDTVVWQQRYVKDITFRFEDVEDYKFIWKEQCLKGRIEITIKRKDMLLGVDRTLFVDQTNVEQVKTLYNLFCDKCKVHKEKLEVHLNTDEENVDEMTTFVFCNHPTVVVLNGDFIKITRQKNAMNTLAYGYAGEKTIDIDDITGMQYQEPTSLLPGYLQFTLPGGIEKTRGVGSALTDENAIVFETTETKYALAIKKYVERTMQIKKQMSNSVSPADEIMKYKKCWMKI